VTAKFGRKYALSKLRGKPEIKLIGLYELEFVVAALYITLYMSCKYFVIP
jgi:hypothetical protein